MKPIAWRAFYRDGSEFNGRDSRREDLPRQGLVVAVVYYDREWRPERPYRDLVGGSDWYYFHADGRVTGSGSGDWGNWVEPDPPPGAVAIRSTQRLTCSVYERIRARAQEAVEAP